MKASKSMVIDGIKIPDKIIEAIRNNNLVVFAGAGVSMCEPTRLPSYNDLAEEIARGTGTTPTKEEPKDKFLGTLEMSGTDVNKIAAKILSNKGLKPSNSHQSIIKLFGRKEQVRIVTTNYDLMFEETCRELKITPKIYSNPALPYGNDFKGIVHLHGDVNDYKNMVLTDGSFGNSYMVSGNVARFLTQMFTSNYTVLFIGYSYEDTVMQYLTRAFPNMQENNRYIFIEKKKKERVSSIGLTPILYKDSDYDQLYSAISQLSEFVNRDIFTWKKIIEETSQLQPHQLQNDLELESEVHEIFKDPFLLKALLDRIHGKDWLKYLNGNGYFSNLFSTKQLTNNDKLLLNWLMQKFMVNDGQDLLDLFFEYNFNLNREVRKVVASSLVFQGINQKALASFLSFIDFSLIDVYQTFTLLEKLEVTNNHFRLQLIQRLLLFSYSYKVTTYPVSTSATEQKYTNSRNVEAYLQISFYQIDDLIKSIDDLSEQYRKELLIWMTNQLVDLFHKEKLGDGYTNFNPFMSIVDNEERTTRDLGAYIQIMKHFLALISPSDNFISNYINRYISSEISILRRLSILLLSNAEYLSPKEKIAQIIGSVGVYSYPEKEEIFTLLKENYPKLCNVEKKCFINHLMEIQIVDDLEPSSKAYTRYNCLTWLENASDDEFIKEAINKIKHEYPEFEPREYPQKKFGPITFAKGIDHPAFSEEIIKKKFEENPEESLDYLLSYEQENFDTPKRWELLNIITSICSKDYAFLEGLYINLCSRNELTTDVWRSILSSLNNHEYDLSQRIKDLLLFEDTWYVEHSLAISNYLYSTSRKLHEQKNNSYSILIFEMILKIWEHTKKTKPVLEEDLPSSAMNSSPGLLALSTMNLVYLHNKDLDASNYRLPDNYKMFFTGMLLDTQIIDAHSVVIGHFYQLFAFDPEWAESNLLKYFDSAAEEDFRKSWQGYMAFSQRLNPEISDLLEPCFLKAIDRIEELKSYKERFMGFVMSLIIYHIDDPVKLFIPAIFHCHDNECIRYFYQLLDNYLKNTENTQIIVVWDRWLHQFLSNRVDNIPTPFEEKEVYHILALLINLNDECVGILENINKLPVIESFVSERRITNLLFDIYHDKIYLRSPNIISHLLIKITDNIIENKEVEIPYPVNQYLKGIVEAMAENDQVIPGKLLDNMSYLCFD